MPVPKSSEWTRLSESKDFVKDTGHLVPGDVEYYGEGWVGIHCLCGLKVYLGGVGREDELAECACGRQYRLLLTVEVLVPS